ncbi:hypothetical protein GN244_ATG19923 [Phytophthora infestans]|uniref:Secreted RxLR effector peptide protein n=1 Tax=Phytophthora infestans TaxID=4787 RepID=A0A833SI41_PHYIN|nr:hypothetical protein GN244_ATG19923 [Phytophthora infestans]
MRFMRLLYPALIIAATLATLCDGSGTAVIENVNGEITTTSTASNYKKPRELSDNTGAALEERRGGGRGGRGGGGRRGSTRKFDRSQVNNGPYTAIGLMYPNDTPYLREDLRKLYRKWLKKQQAKETRRLRA